MKYRESNSSASKIVSLTDYRNSIPTNLGSSDIFLLPYFEELYSCDEISGRSFHWSDTFRYDKTLSSKRVCYDVCTSNYKIWPDRLEGRIKITDLNSKNSRPSVSDMTAVLVHVFERLSIFLCSGNELPGESAFSSHRARNFIANQLLVQTAGVAENVTDTSVQLWVIRLEDGKRIDWAGAIGQAFFVFAQGHLYSARDFATQPVDDTRENPLSSPDDPPSTI
jgi:hypothetical protein